MVACNGMDNNAWNQAIRETIQYLGQQKDSGRSFVRVDPSLLRNLKAPALGARQAQPAANPDKRAAYAKLEAEIKACVQCSHLVSFRSNVVPGVGNLNAQIMFVGEAPGAD